MKTLALTVARTPILGRLALMIYRASLASRYMMAPVVNLFKWLVKSKETTNLTYDLEQSNKLYLAALIADVMGLRFEQICGYIQELEEDKELNQHLQNAIKKSDYAFMADHNIYYGRRLGWYAIVRALKPKVVIETGVDKGLGACILAAALKRNKAEGNEGHYMGQILIRSRLLIVRSLQGEWNNFVWRFDRVLKTPRCSD
ncbi:hypothetical protein Q2T42_07245 [Leptolyngbya boryana CZ1]|uniref:Uncharacterized protein n=1 Tax=Leptolyngbya boryana CZ1 TaxID=3060204 RepID=A0AA96WXR4_LEPBY|nr:hypothetical protein [Leptolyngbya boryana]WNZ47625.1 hypothetical protein Q2T42_07245 [Leptolyngbya boryana CZ1]